MLQPRLQAPLRAVDKTSHLITSCCNTVNASIIPLNSSRLSPFLTFVRHAGHQTQGRANGPGDSDGRRLGAKKTGEQYVIPGNIIFRQRGTKWFPGENCGMGRDHTIFATETGYVKYYLDPHKHPKRRYIGVALERNGVLPTPLNAARKRRLNMVAVPMPPREKEVERDLVAEDPTTVRQVPGSKRKELPAKKVLGLRPGYMYREGNWEIGRAAERAGITVRKFDRKDRWLAWRKRNAGIKRVAQKKAIKNTGKGKKKKI